MGLRCKGIKSEPPSPTKELEIAQTSDTTPRLHGSNCMPVEGPITGQKVLELPPELLKDSSSVGAHHGNHECQTAL